MWMLFLVDAERPLELKSFKITLDTSVQHQVGGSLGPNNQPVPKRIVLTGTVTVNCRLFCSSFDSSNSRTEVTLMCAFNLCTAVKCFLKTQNRHNQRVNETKGFKQSIFSRHMSQADTLLIIRKLCFNIIKGYRIVTLVVCRQMVRSTELYRQYSFPIAHRLKKIYM